MNRFRLLLAGLVLLAAAWLGPADVRAQTPGAALFGGNFCPGGVKELAMPFPDVRLCPYQGHFQYLGAIVLLGSNFCPYQTFEAAGQALPLVQYHQLFSLYVTRFGGDGKTRFNLPNLRGKAPTGNPALVYCVLMQGMYPVRQ